MLRDVLLRQFLRRLLDNLAQSLAQLFFEPGMEDRIDRRDHGVVSDFSIP